MCLETPSISRAPPFQTTEKRACMVSMSTLPFRSATYIMSCIQREMHEEERAIHIKGLFMYKWALLSEWLPKWSVAFHVSPCFAVRYLQLPRFIKRVCVRHLTLFILHELTRSHKISFTIHTRSLSLEERVAARSTSIPGH